MALLSIYKYPKMDLLRQYALRLSSDDESLLPQARGNWLPLSGVLHAIASDAERRCAHFTHASLSSLLYQHGQMTLLLALRRMFSKSTKPELGCA